MENGGSGGGIVGGEGRGGNGADFWFEGFRVSFNGFLDSEFNLN